MPAIQSHLINKCPYGQPGDKLWVREPWREGDEIGRSLYYKVDEEWNKGAGWKPSIHMPRWASRITLEIVSVRVERLQDLSQDDARSEGVENLFTLEEVCRRPDLEPHSHSWKNYLWHGHVGDTITGKQSDAWDYQFSGYKRDNPKGSFSSLWEMINGSGSWNANPWVWVVEFKRV